MLRYLTAGESHGPCLLTIIEGLPYGLTVDLEFVNGELRRRQGGYGRGARMKMEQDRVEIQSGVRNSKTLGSPLTLRIANNVHNSEELPPITKPRPGHADLAGAIKFGTPDARGVSERSSARETSARVAAGAVANAFLGLFGARAVGYVVELGGIAAKARAESAEEALRRRSASEFYALDSEQDAAWRARIDEDRSEGDTLGGIFEVCAWGLPPGLGSHAGWELKLDGALARALMSVQTVKAVETGLGIEAARRRGSQMHDEIVAGLGRTRNNAGGIEGGMTNGQPLVVRAACKPIATLRQPLRSVDLATGEEVRAAYERSDVCVVPAASVIGEAVVAFELARAFLDKFGGDTMEEVRERFDVYAERVARLSRSAEAGSR
ncbi:MAG: chorismate synthase [Planctomycetes bacterium]|nr:chorismate synthase [Planctomycetota bacterium]